MEEQLKVTCLHDSHLALGAKMSPFAGFDMPIQYSSITEEHLGGGPQRCGYVRRVSHG